MTFDGPFHREEIVTGADGTKYLVRVGRTGVHRLTPWGGSQTILVLVTWLRWRQHEHKTWIVTARRRGIIIRPDFVSEEYPDRASAARRADEVAEAIVSAQLLASVSHRA
jgi:hypothetical protein